jgi:RNA polymerase sporulation-specific sigma factor
MSHSGENQGFPPQGITAAAPGNTASIKKKAGGVMRSRVEICGINTAKLPVLKHDEMTALLRRAHAGDGAAREQLICGNLRLVLSVLQRFAGRGESADDLFQVGCIGLMKAIDNFDVNQPVRFSTYGVPMIVGEIRRYLRDNSAMRVSRSMRDTAYKVLRAREALMAENQREPTVEQLAQYLGIPREEVVFAMDAISDPVSLYEPLYADSGDPVCVMDQVKDEKGTDDSWLDRIALKDAIARLDPRQQSILALRFCQGKTQMEVSSEIGISQAQVSRLEKTALGSIRKNM